MEETDAAIGAILAELEALGLDDETLVIFTSDQGPDGEELHFGGPMLNGAKGQVYEAGVRIPTIIRACGQGEARVISDLGSHVDVYRTVLDAAEISVPPAGANGADIDGRSWLPELAMSDADWPPAAPSATRRDFAFSRYGRTITAVSRAGLFDGTAPSAEWYALPEAKGVCAFVGQGGLDGTGSFGVSRGPSKPLVLCDPDEPGADAGCAALGINRCRVIGKRCTGFGEAPYDRPRCHNNKDCPGAACQDEGQAMNVPCNVCIRASWKLVTANRGAGPAATELYELSSDPEESRSYSDAAGVSPSPADQVAVRQVEQVLGGALDRWKCSCLDPPPAPLSSANPMSNGVPGGTWEGREPSCRDLLPECKTAWAPADRLLYPP